MPRRRKARICVGKHPTSYQKVREIVFEDERWYIYLLDISNEHSLALKVVTALPRKRAGNFLLNWRTDTKAFLDVWGDSRMREQLPALHKHLGEILTYAQLFD